MLGTHYTIGNMYLDYQNKKLYVGSQLVTEGTRALDYAFDLLPPSKWNRQDEPPILVDDEEYPY